MTPEKDFWLVKYKFQKKAIQRRKKPRSCLKKLHLLEHRRKSEIF